jgi:sulfofructose kinase
MPNNSRKDKRAVSFDAIGIGLTCYDLAAIIERWPEGDRGRLLEYMPAGGGMCSNAIVTMQRLGARCALATAVGGDDPGRFLIEDLRREKVDTRFVREVRTGKTQVSLNISVRGSDEKTLLALKTEQFPLTPRHVGRAFWQDLAACRLLHLDGFYTDLALPALARARRAGVTISLDITHADKNAETLIRGSDIVFAPVEFVEAFFGHRHFEQAAWELARMGPRWAGVTLGEYGSIGVADGELIRQPAFNVDVVDTVGAGDAFHGGIAYGAIRGWSLPETMRFASAVGAISCTALSPRAPLPTLRQTQRFLREHAGKARGDQPVRPVLKEDHA